MLWPDSYFFLRSAASLSRSPPVTRLPFLSSTTRCPPLGMSAFVPVPPAQPGQPRWHYPGCHDANARRRAGRKEREQTGEDQPTDDRGRRRNSSSLPSCSSTEAGGSQPSWTSRRVSARRASTSATLAGWFAATPVAAEGEGAK